MNTDITVKTGPTMVHIPRLLEGQERVQLLRRIRGMWKSRKPAPIQELEQIRGEWERDVS